MSTQLPKRGRARGLFEHRPKGDVTYRHFKSATAGNGLTLGQNLVTASYPGDANFQASSGSVNLLVYNQALPLSLSLQSSSATAGGAGFTLTVNGANFASNSVVLWNGAVRKTTFVSSMQLTAAISKADIAKETTALVTVANPAPNEGLSVALPFAVMSATPVVAIAGSSVSAAANGGGYVLTLMGSDFVTGSTVEWNGVNLPTTYVSPWQISATVASSNLDSMPAEVTVSNPAGASTGFELQ